MPNKILALLILIGTISGLFFMYFYFFVGYTSTLSIESNIEDYRVQLHSKKIGKSFDYECSGSPCILTNVSPLEYSLRITKDGYKNVFQDISVKPRTSIGITIFVEKEVSFDQIVDEETTLSPQEKISFIRDKKRAYKFFPFSDTDYGYFLQKSDKILTLYVNINGKGKKLGDFATGEISTLDIQKVIDRDFIYFQIGIQRYFYDIGEGSIKPLDFKVSLHYIKSGNIDIEFLFVTEVGTYIYNVEENGFEYFSAFKDFVYRKDGYVGVIYSDEEKKRKNFGWEDKSSNLIIKYNPSKGERSIIYETNLDITKIYKEEGYIFFEAGGEKYKLDNY